MGIPGWLRMTWNYIVQRPARPRRRRRYRISDSLELVAAQRNEWQGRAERAERRLAQLEESLREREVEVRKLQGETEVQESHIHGLSKVVVAQQGYVEMVTAIQAARATVAENLGGQPGGAIIGGSGD